ncbi:MAG: OmpA family protein, partial [Bacteroidetes bacterium]|nr:OmpA family protein [Bacteroidota bacterium]
AMDSILNSKKTQNETKKSGDKETSKEGTNKKVLVRGKNNKNEVEKESSDKNVLIRGKSNENQSPNNNGVYNTANNESVDENKNERLQVFSKYNFVPGDKIIFHDDLIGEENGEFPSRWDLTEGNAENAAFDNNNVINFDNKSIITPLMETDEYLPEVFTIEFDAYYDDERMASYVYHQLYKLRFWNGDSYVVLPNKLGMYNPIKVYRYGASLSGKIKGQKKDFKGFEESLKEKQPVWRHIAIAFNKRSLKVFVDEFRALNIPNLGFMPKMVSIEAYTNTHIKEPYTRVIKNIRIAEGGKKLYDRVMADGKFVTRGILFDVNKATIKPESMGVLNQVAKMMQQHTDLNFSIEGHTDSDGAEDYNLQLSQKRAAAVKDALSGLGIDGSRMETKGLGESVPVSDNTSPEGKANNRRVEFIKI